MSIVDVSKTNSDRSSARRTLRPLGTGVGAVLRPDAAGYAHHVGRVGALAVALRVSVVPPITSKLCGGQEATAVRAASAAARAVTRRPTRSGMERGVREVRAVRRGAPRVPPESRYDA